MSISLPRQQNYVSSELQHVLGRQPDDWVLAIDPCCFVFILRSSTNKYRELVGEILSLSYLLTFRGCQVLV